MNLRNLSAAYQRSWLPVDWTTGSALIKKKNDEWLEDISDAHILDKNCDDRVTKR